MRILFGDFTLNDFFQTKGYWHILLEIRNIPLEASFQTYIQLVGWLVGCWY